MMKVFLTSCLFLIAASSIVTAQKGAPLKRQQVKEAEQRLADLGYWTGPVDGRFDSATRAALISFQKWEGRTITGRLTLEEVEAIRSRAAPVPRDGSYEHVEIDVDRQVLLLVDDTGAVRVLPVSTGTDKPFSYDGQTSIAYTPRGRFVVYDKGVGWEDNLPGMYYANYISGGIAIHGSYDVPPQPASHGCIRIPIFAEREVSKRMKIGTIVLVYDKVSFVSARSWVENPKLKEAALANSALN
jgi:peptidoglycan hydrolase-like protein with peptidoglycan-binding domain